MDLDSFAWCTLDGDSRQIQVFEQQEVQSYLAEQCIIVGKPPGSTTAITQPLDSYNFFKGKTFVRNQGIMPLTPEYARI
jgi:hypothetical protein